MKISYSILKEYCKVSLTPEKLAELLTNHGVKVESIEKQGNDAVFELEITANRPDCLSFLGVAREVALLTKQKGRQRPLRSLNVNEGKPRCLPCVTGSKFIKVLSPKLCPIYIGRIIRDVKIGSSPDWLKAHLESLDFRSINNVVDITNFVLMETGQPLHAFDLDKLAGRQIIVRTAHKSEKMTAIDGNVYELSDAMLVIADTEKPVAIAGVMGGKDTEVTGTSRNILLESAYFNPASIRKTARHLKLSSDSSYRFERTVDPLGVEIGSQKATQLILELAGGTLTDYQALDYFKYKDRKVSFRIERVSRILGVTIPLLEIKRILIGLGLKIISTPRSTLNALRLLIPSFRPDITGEIDVIEELARVWGYHNIPVTAPAIELNVSQEDKTADVIKSTRDFLVETGYNEVLTGSFWDKSTVPETDQQNLIGLLDLEGTTDRFLRNNLARGLMEIFNLNENYLRAETKRTIKLFEISKVYFRKDTSNEASNTEAVPSGTKERIHLCILDNNGFQSLKGAIRDLFIELGLEAEKISYTDAIKITAPPVPPADSENIVIIQLNGVYIGYIAILPNIQTQDITKSVQESEKIAISELDFEAIIEQANLSRQYKPFSRLPEVKRDLAIVVPERTKWEDVEKVSRQAISSAKDVPLEKLEFFDLYRGKQIPDGHKSIAFSLSFRHPTKTLSSNDVDEVVKTVVNALEKNLQASLRA